MVCTTIPRQPISKVSPRLNSATPMSTNKKLMDMVPVTEGSWILSAEAISAMAR